MEPFLKQFSEKQLSRALGTLTPQEYQVISYRFGIEEKPQLSLLEVAEKMGLTRERVYTIQQRGMERMEIMLDILPTILPNPTDNSSLTQQLYRPRQNDHQKPTGNNGNGSSTISLLVINV